MGSIIAYTQSFAKEIHNLSKLSHQNVIRFEGYLLEYDYPSIIMTWAVGGTVIEYIKKFPKCDLAEIVRGQSFSIFK